MTFTSRRLTFNPYPPTACCWLKGRSKRQLLRLLLYRGGGMNVYVYVDGFNLFHRALRGTPYKWLDLCALSARLLDRADTVEVVRYFTARVSARAGKPDSPRNQQVYLSALSTLPQVRFHYGRFLPKTKKRPLVSDPRTFVEVHDVEEKGSDVNLASHLLNDAWLARSDAVLVMSQDTDLIEPIRMVSKGLKVPVGLVWLDGRAPDRKMATAATFVRHVTKSDLAASQFSNPLKRKDGGEIHKPADW